MAKAKQILVLAVTQCLRGGVSLGAYAVGVALEANGVISGGDMTTEAVVTKLGYLFGLTNDMQVRSFFILHPFVFFRLPDNLFDESETSCPPDSASTNYTGRDIVRRP